MRLSLMGVCAVLVFCSGGWAATFVVNSTADTVDASPGDGVAEDASGDTTLRAAIMEANALAGDDDITLPAGTYTLAIAGTDEDAAATGDLDIDSIVTINGADAATTIISAATIDRVLHLQPGADLTLSGVTVRDGLTPGFLDFGGGILSLDATLTIDNAIIRNNHATAAGGGIASGASFETTATLTITNSTITQNVSELNAAGIGSSAGGGGFSPTTAIATISNCVISENGAVELGNGVSNSSAGNDSHATLVITDSMLDDNDGIFDSAWGGGVWNSAGTDGTATTTITRSTVSNHAAPAAGIVNSASGGIAELIVVNSTISGNSNYDDEDGRAGGIMNEAINDPTSEAIVTVRNSTITNNEAVELFMGFGGFGVGGVGNRAFSGGTATFTLENTIVAGNISTGTDVDAQGTFMGNANNLIGDTTGSTGFSGSDMLNTNPLLGALANNGGPTLTHAIPVNSPARNAGDNTGAPATDQRGATRIVNGTIDIGAFEFQGLASVFADFGFGGTELGTVSNPFNTLAEALGAASNGATITIDSGTSAETLTISQPATLQSSGGSVRIGVSGTRSVSVGDPAETGFVSRN